MANDKKEVWLRGPLNGYSGLIQPVAHALLQAREEVNELMTNFTEEHLWTRPAGVASVGFHLQHLSGVLDRLFSYAMGQQLSDQQWAQLSREGKEDSTIHTIDLVEQFNKKVEDCLLDLQQLDPGTLLEPREVGRGKLPSTTLGLYVHAAEHTMRHLGQLLVTVKVLPALK